MSGNRDGIKNDLTERGKRFFNIFLGIVFLSSGALKCANIYSFVQEIREYIVLYLNDVLYDYSLALAIMICSVEIMLGLWSFMKAYDAMFSAVSFVMLLFFVYLTGINYLCPSIIGSVESCGCFGELIHFTPMTSFLKSFVLFLASALLLACNYRQITISYLRFVLQMIYTYICFAASIVLPLYSFIAFKELEYATYLGIGSILCVMITFIVIVATHHYRKQ